MESLGIVYWRGHDFGPHLNSTAKQVLIRGARASTYDLSLMIIRHSRSPA